MFVSATAMPALAVKNPSCTATPVDVPPVDALVDGRYRLIEQITVEQIGVEQIGGTQRQQAWRARDVRLNRDVQLEFVAAPAGSLQAILAQRAVPVLDAGEWGGGACVFIVHATSVPSAERVSTTEVVWGPATYRPLVAVAAAASTEPARVGAHRTPSLRDRLSARVTAEFARPRRLRVQTIASEVA